MKVRSNGSNHMTSNAAMHIYGKHLEISSSLEQKTNDLES